MPFELVRNRPADFLTSIFSRLKPWKIYEVLGIRKSVFLPVKKYSNHLFYGINWHSISRHRKRPSTKGTNLQWYGFRKKHSCKYAILTAFVYKFLVKSPSKFLKSNFLSVNILKNKYYQRQWNQTQDLRAQFPQDRTKKFENIVIFLIHILHHFVLQKQRLSNSIIQKLQYCTYLSECLQ